MEKKYILFLFSSPFFLLASCTSQAVTFNSFSDWDKNLDHSINRYEFVAAYTRQNFFDKWSSGSSSVTYDKLLEEVFRSIDNDKSGTLDENEFNSQIKQFYFGLFNDSFGTWDDTSNKLVEKSEFLNHATNSKLAPLWDSNGDNYIRENEMAEGMFYVCDSDNNGEITETELSIWKQGR
ncbi:MAG TPA: hypothetical protein VFU05_16700 [Cyclobacteriaceae bacterium]|nr:hypothetical protein [Cyclobacteriaceae bacterium]